MLHQEEFFLSEDFITLGQLLKEKRIIPTGGAAKWFLKEHVVNVNGQQEERRGRKLYSGNLVEIRGIKQILIRD